MLVLSRRENDRIVFPALGISVEVMKLTRSRASIGICAPKGIRIVRHELAGEEERRPSCEGLVEAVRQQITTQIHNQVDAATKKLQSAQEDLAAGNTEEALATLAQALAELDRLRSKTQCAESSAETVAESSTGYKISVADDHAARGNRVLLVDRGGEQNDKFLSDLGRRGFHVDLASDPLIVLYELSRQEKPDAILLTAIETEPDQQATVRLIRNCSQHPDVPIVCAAGGLGEDEKSVTTSAKSAADQLRTAIDRRWQHAQN